MKLPKIFTRSARLKQAELLNDSLLEALSASYQQNDEDRARNIALNEENAQLTELIAKYNLLCRNLTDLVENLQHHNSQNQSQALLDALSTWLDHMSQPSHSDEAKNLFDSNRFSQN